MSTPSQSEPIACLQCLKTAGKLLTYTSQFANVDYFRCDRCGYVWTVEKHAETQSAMAADPASPSPLKLALARLALRSVPAVGASVRPERRDLVVRDSLERRVIREFAEMPGTALTAAQATRLFHLPAPQCARVLTRLVDEKALRLMRDGRYRLHRDVA